jgi:hypothetical protein
LSPFKRVLIESDVRVGSLEGHASGVRIGELSDAASDLTVAQLAQEAIIEPLSWLAESSPDARVRVVIDALDESPDLARVLPLGTELPGNCTWLITTRPGAHLDRFAAEAGGQVTRIDLADPDVLHLELADARKYVTMRVSDPAVRAVIERRQLVDDTVHAIAEASEGNFLYMYHALFGLEEAAHEGRLPPALTEETGLPRGLDAIYSYQVSRQLDATVDKTERLSFRRVLGVLAVQFAPLTAGQIATFAAVTPEFVDEVVARIAQFIERADAEDDVGYAFFHSSFAEFLLTQNRKRNPFPLQPAKEHHLRIVGCYEDWTDQDWRDCDDIYALTHLTDHAVAAHAVDLLAALGTGAFLRRQWEVTGSSTTIATTRSAARLAAADSRDETFLDMLRGSYDLAAEMMHEWTSGRFTLSLLADGPAALARLRAGGLQPPWSGFLSAERLLDLGQVGDALELLNSVAADPWSGYMPESMPTSTGLNGTVPEGLLFDMPDEQLAGFLGRVAELDADLALRINKRLNGARPWDQIPNVQTFWRDALHALVARGPDPAACRAAVDVTTTWMIDRPYPVGRAGIAEALYALLARVAAANPGDVAWFARQVLIVVQLRQKSPAGLNDDTWLAGATGNLTGLLDIREAAPEHSGLRRLIDEGIAGLIEGLPSLSMPTEFSYDRRAALLGQYAYLLNRAGQRRWRKTASIALRACVLDASSGDPPLDAIALALRWLGKIPDHKVAGKARALAAQLHVSDRDNEPVQPREVSLAAMRTTRSPYEKGRMALQLWRQGSVTLVELADTLPATPSSRKKAEPPTALSDLVAEALVQVAVTLPVDWGPQAIDRLWRTRTESRRRRVSLDELAMHGLRWSRLTELGRTDLVRSEVTAAWTTALAAKAINMLVHCCSVAAQVDPALATRWWRTVVPLLVPEDLDAAAATVAVAAVSSPSLLSELLDVEIRPEHALGVCQMWLPCPPLSAAAAPVLRGIRDRLDPAVAAAEQAEGRGKKDSAGQILAEHLWLAAAVAEDNEHLSAVARDLSDKVLRWWRANTELGTLLLEHSGNGLIAVAGPGSDAVVTILADILDHPAANETGLRTDIVAIMRGATRLKEIVPEPSRRGFENVRQRWTDMLDPEYGNRTDLAYALAAIVADTLETQFKSAHERTLYETTARLTRWCCERPASSADLAGLEKAIGQVPSLDLRSLLMAPVATAWLQLGEHGHARTAAEQSSLSALHRAGYTQGLRPPGAVRDHVITLMTSDISHSPGEAIGDLLRAWFRLRLEEIDPFAYFTRIEQWIAANQPAV